MKKNILPIAVFGLALVVFALSVFATPTIVVGTGATVNNATTAYTAVLSFTYNPALQQYTVVHGSLSQTTDIKIWIRSTLDNVNFVTNGLWYPSNTNAATEIIYAGAYAVTNYTGVVVGTTNNQTGMFISYGQ